MKNRTSLFAGIALFLCFCLLTGTGKMVSEWGGGAPAIFFAELLSFLLPCGVLYFFGAIRKAFGDRVVLHHMPKGTWGFTIKMGIMIAVLSLFLNFLIYQLAGMTGMDISGTALDASASGMSLPGRLLIIAVASPLVEELFLRGALFPAGERAAGTMVSLVASGMCFAMLHGNLLNFAGPLVAGVAYAYLTFVFQSVWPAVVAHVVNNLYYLLVTWITNTYAAYGIWNYFAVLNGLLLLLFLYLTLRAAERLLVRGQVPHFKKSSWKDSWKLLKNPGVIAFVAAFVAKAILHWI